MQDLLTATIVAIVILFTVSAAADFTAGLIKLWKSAGSQTQPRVNTTVLIEQSPAAPKLEVEVTLDPWTLPVEETAIALPTEQPSVRQLLLPAARRIQIATLDWAERNLPPAEIYAAEMPCAIALAKSRSPKVAPVIELATKKQLESCSIRRLKALARQIKLRGYGSMRVTELASALENKVAAPGTSRLVPGAGHHLKLLSDGKVRELTSERLSISVHPKIKLKHLLNPSKSSEW